MSGSLLSTHKKRAEAHAALDAALADYPKAECREVGDGTVEVWSGPSREDDWQGPPTPPELVPSTTDNVAALADKLVEAMRERLEK